MAQLIDGKQIAGEIRQELAKEIASFKEKSSKVPGLAVVLVGDDPASQVYVSMKGKACNEVGIYSEEHRLPANTSQEELLNLIDDLNANERIHGILVQLPLPKGLDEKEVLHRIDPKKT